MFHVEHGNVSDKTTFMWPRKAWHVVCVIPEITPPIGVKVFMIIGLHARITSQNWNYYIQFLDNDFSSHYIILKNSMLCCPREMYSLSRHTFNLIWYQIFLAPLGLPKETSFQLHNIGMNLVILDHIHNVEQLDSSLSA